MVRFKLNGEETVVEDNTTVKEMLDQFGFTRHSLEADDYLLVTESNVMIQGPLDRFLIEEGQDIGVIAIPVGG